MNVEKCFNRSLWILAQYILEIHRERGKLTSEPLLLKYMSEISLVSDTYKTYLEQMPIERRPEHTAYTKKNYDYIRGLVFDDRRSLTINAVNHTFRLLTAFPTEY